MTNIPIQKLILYQNTHNFNPNLSFIKFLQTLQEEQLIDAIFYNNHNKNLDLGNFITQDQNINISEDLETQLLHYVTDLDLNLSLNLDGLDINKYNSRYYKLYNVNPDDFDPQLVAYFLNKKNKLTLNSNIIDKISKLIFNELNYKQSIPIKSEIIDQSVKIYNLESLFSQVEITAYDNLNKIHFNNIYLDNINENCNDVIITKDISKNLLYMPNIYVENIYDLNNKIKNNIYYSTMVWYYCYIYKYLALISDNKIKFAINCTNSVNNYIYYVTEKTWVKNAKKFVSLQNKFLYSRKYKFKAPYEFLKKSVSL
jgi:hypothetical protein